MLGYIIMWEFLPGENFHLLSLAKILLIIHDNFLSSVNDPTEDMVTFTTLVKIFPPNFFCTQYLAINFTYLLLNLCMACLVMATTLDGCSSFTLA